MKTTCNLNDTTIEGMERLQKQVRAITGKPVSVASTEIVTGNSYYVFGLSSAERELVMEAHPLWEGRPILFS